LPRAAAPSVCSPLLAWSRSSAARLGIVRLRKGRKNRRNRLRRQPFSGAFAALRAPAAAAERALPTPDPFWS